MNKHLITANDKEIFDLTGCLSMCEKYAYSAQQEGSTIFEENPDNLNTTLMLFLYYSNVEHELREQVKISKLALQDVKHTSFQYIIYDINDFIADVGGYLGLLLGQSIYGIYELLTTWLGYRLTCGKGNILQGKKSLPQ